MYAGTARRLTILGMDFCKVDGPSIMNTEIADYTMGGSDPTAPKHSVVKARQQLQDGMPGATDVVEFVVVD